MSMRYVSLRALQRSPSARTGTAESRWHAPLPNNDGGLLSPMRTIRIDPERLAQILGATTKTNQYGDCLSVRCWCAQPPRYSPDSRALKLLSPEAPDQIADPDQWLFLDTETTGLAGGSGTYAFLVGIAWWEGGGLEIEQFFLREYSEERSMLFALRERIAEHPVVVTFNGKSFDWPLLETRYRMSRKVSMPMPRAHLDFLHSGEIFGGCVWGLCVSQSLNVMCSPGTGEPICSLE
jgi:RNase_H superfamily